MRDFCTGGAAGFIGGTVLTGFFASDSGKGCCLAGLLEFDSELQPVKSAKLRPNNKWGSICLKLADDILFSCQFYKAPYSTKMFR